MKSAQFEARAQPLLSELPQRLNLQISGTAGQRGAGPRNGPIHHVFGDRFITGHFGANIVDRLASTPSHGMQTCIDHHARYTVHLPEQSTEFRLGIAIQAEVLTQRRRIQSPSLHEGGGTGEAAQPRQIRALTLQLELIVMARLGLAEEFRRQRRGGMRLQLGDIDVEHGRTQAIRRPRAIRQARCRTRAVRFDAANREFATGCRREQGRDCRVDLHFEFLVGGHELGGALIRIARIAAHVFVKALRGGIAQQRLHPLVQMLDFRNSLGMQLRRGVRAVGVALREERVPRVAQRQCR